MVQSRLFAEAAGEQPELRRGQCQTRGQVSIHFDRAENLYADWPTPMCIISDGPYGVSGFPGDCHDAESLHEWYEPHVKAATFRVQDEILTMQAWLRHEWKRAGLPLRLANEACGVRNAATRKYLTADHLWYYPPVDTFVKLAAYANEHGDPRGRPYFSTDGEGPLSGEQWSRLRAKFKCEVGVTNVWREPQVGGAERIQGTRNGMKYKFRSLHGSQKPLKLIDLIIRASTDRDDVVWEPFGGLCPGAIVSWRLGREYHGAETIPEFYAAAVERLQR